MVSQADGEAIISALLSSTSINGTLQALGISFNLMATLITGLLPMSMDMESQPDLLVDRVIQIDKTTMSKWAKDGPIGLD